jgi:hypothetical protein
MFRVLSGRHHVRSLYSVFKNRFCKQHLKVKITEASQLDISADEPYCRMVLLFAI